MSAATYEEARDEAYAAWRRTQDQLSLDDVLNETSGLPNDGHQRVPAVSLSPSPLPFRAGSGTGSSHPTP